MPTGNDTSRQGRSRLGRELGLALAFKILALAVLWFAFFRPDPGRPRPEPRDLLNPPAPTFLQQEKPHDQR